MPTEYLEYAPNPRLSDFVACYWSLRTIANSSARTQRILPDGCIDFIFDNASDVSGVIVGSMTKAVSVALKPGARFFGVRFRPGGARAFVNFSLKEITDARLQPQDVWRAEAAELSSAMYGASVQSQIRVIESFLEKKLAAGVPPNPKVQAAVAFIASRGGDCSIDATSRALELSRQQLNRIFGEAVGLSPKTFVRIIRLQAALKDARRSCVKDWAALALNNGYYDQAHLIADFKDLTGTTPTKYFSSKI